MENKKRKIAYYKKLGMLFGLSATVLLNSGCSNQDKQKPITTIVEEVGDDTCFDEIINEATLAKVDELEEYLNLSEQLHDIEIPREDVATDNCALLSPEELRILMSDYQNSKKEKILSEEEICSLEKVLTIQEKLTNKYIYNQGYSLMYMVTSDGFKSKMLDMQGLDESSYSESIIPSSLETRYNDEYSRDIYLGEYKLSRNTNLADLLGSVYEMQQKGEAYYYLVIKESEYNEGRNKLIREAIETIKKVLPEKYEINSENIIKKVRK